MPKKERKKKLDLTFRNFSEFWSKTKLLTEKDREAYLRELPASQQELIENSYVNDGWDDVLNRNRTDILLDQIKKEFAIDLIRLRCDVLRGRSVYLKRKFWKTVQERFGGFTESDLFYIFGSYKAVEEAGNDEEYKLVVATKTTSKQAGEFPREADWL